MLSFGLCSSGCKKLGNFRISLGNSSFSLRNFRFFRIKTRIPNLNLLGILDLALGILEFLKRLALR